MFYKHAADTKYTTESGRKKNKQERTRVSPKRKKGEVFDTFLTFYSSVSVTSVYSNKMSHTSTWSADSSSRAR